MRPLPAACRWIDYPEKSCLMWNAGCVAVVGADGSVRIQWSRGAHFDGQAASLAQGKRHVERWVSAVRGLPPGKRAMALRAARDSPRIPHAP